MTLKRSKVRTWAGAAVALCALMAPHAWAQGQKVALVDFQAAISATAEGRKAAADLQTRVEPKRKDFEARQNEINSLKDQLQKGQATLSDDRKQALSAEIDQKTKRMQRDAEDAQADLNQQQQAAVQQIVGKLRPVIEKYARDNGYTIVLNRTAIVPSQDGSQTLLFAYGSQTVDITREIIAAYDKSSGVAPPAPGK